MQLKGLRGGDLPLPQLDLQPQSFDSHQPWKSRDAKVRLQFLKLTQKSLDPSNSSYPPLFSLVKYPGVPVLQLKLVGVRKHRWMGTCSALASVIDIKNDVQLQVSILQYAKTHQPGFPRLTYGIPSSNISGGSHRIHRPWDLASSVRSSASVSTRRSRGLWETSSCSSSTLAVSVWNSKSCALSLNDTYPDLILWLVPRCPYHSESSVMVSRRNAPASQPWRSAWQKWLTQSAYTYLKRQKKRARERAGGQNETRTRGRFVDTDL